MHSPAGAADFRSRRDLVEILANFVEFQFVTYRLLGAGNPNATAHKQNFKSESFFTA